VAEGSPPGEPIGHALVAVHWAPHVAALATEPGEICGLGAASAETLAASNRLTEAIEERQRELRVEFSERFELFAGDESRRMYKKTFKSR